MNNGLNRDQRAAKVVLKFILTNKEHFKPENEKHLIAAVGMNGQSFLL